MRLLSLTFVMDTLFMATLFMAASIGVCESQTADSSQRKGAGLPGRGLCAHRGAMDTHPENTLSAFREAIRCDAHMIES